MFSFLKDKLKGAIKKFTKSADEESETIQEPEVTEKPKEEILHQKTGEEKPKKDTEKKPGETVEKIKTEEKVLRAKETTVTAEKKEKVPEKKIPAVITEEIEPERLPPEKKTVDRPKEKKVLEEKRAEPEKEQARPEENLPRPPEPEAKKPAESVPEKPRRTESFVPPKGRTGEELKKEITHVPTAEVEPPEQSPDRKEDIFQPLSAEAQKKSWGFAGLKKAFGIGKAAPEAKPEPEVQEEKKPPTTEKPKAQVPAAEEKTKVQVPAAEEKKSGFFSKIKDSVTKTVLSEEKFDELFWELELALLENNVAVQVIEKMKADLKEAIVGKPIPRGGLEEAVLKALRKSVDDIFDVPIPDILALAKEKKPYVICFIGINGSGKTTSIAKVAHYLKGQGLEVVLAAGDTFRAAAIDQLSHHGDNLNVKVIKHDYGSDSAAVAFDAIKHAEAKGKDVVLIDTAGRMHSNANLMDELKKVIRVAKPDLKVFVGESITGNDCVEQAETFDQAVGIDALILTKADIDEKGGAALSISYVTKKPIIFIGMGQEYADLKPFSPEIVTGTLGI